MIYELFSQRKKKLAESAKLDTYQYDIIPTRLRVQLQQILADAIGRYHAFTGYEFSDVKQNNESWEFIHKTLCREIGVHRLDGSENAQKNILNFIGKAESDQVIDTIELCCRVIERVIAPKPEYQWKNLGIEGSPEQALDEINYRFREAGVGYQFESGQAIRIDSQYCHQEIVKPALTILSDKNFEGAQQEFLSAHAHYRAGEHQQAIVEAAKAFESTLKIACDIKGWKYDRGARASDLLKVIRSNSLWPDYLDASFDQLVATLSSGLPKVRNEQAAHGQGAIPKRTPAYIASYALNLAAAKIVMIGEAISRK